MDKQVDKQPADKPFWQTPSSELLRRLTSSEDGLSTAEARERLSSFGRNSISAQTGHLLLGKLWRRATEPLVILLAAAALISGLTGDVAGLWIILTILLLSVALDVLQEHRAETAAETLKQSVSVRADVMRDGVPHSIPPSDIVPGDVIELRAGDLVPADGVLLSSRDLHVNQAKLTGEAYPVAKSIDVSTETDMADAGNALFQGSSVISGTGLMLAVATGANTRFGAIASALSEKEPPTAFERDMRQFGLLIVKLTGGLILVVLAAHLATSRPIAESLLFVLALAVGLTPELLPMITTVSLSRGALRLAKGGVIVKRLAALHSLGAMDVLCTDKTGTLTEARISLVRHIRPDGEEDAAVFRLAWLNSHFETGVRSPLDEAILAHDSPPDAEGISRIDEVPFDFERRRVSVLVDDGTKRLLIVKGAPEEILSHCARIEQRDGSLKPADDAARQDLRILHDKLAADGLRLLGIAWRSMPRDASSCRVADEDGLVFAGFAVFLDPPKSSAIAALKQLRELGIEVKIISGDHELVVAHVAAMLDFKPGETLMGRDIASLDDHALQARVEKTTLFCRVDPAQKSRILLALRARGHVVGYMGDGVNDAPSLKVADVGLSVDVAVDVAKEAADLILTRPDLGMVAEAVLEGRRTFANVMKYIRIGTSSNFGNMVSMAAASLFLPFLPMLPVQILLNNLIYDASESGIPFDTVEEGEVAAPQIWDMKALTRFTLAMGLLSSVFDIATFAMLRLVFEAGPEPFRTGWFMESMATQILVIFVVRTRHRALAGRPHPALIASSLMALAVALAVPFLPFGSLLGFAPPSWPMLASLALIVAAYLALAEILKTRMWSER